MYRFVLLGLLLLSSTLNASSNEEELIKLTREYVATLDTDLSAQRSFYAPEARFTDPTSALFGEPWDIRGADNIVSFFSKASEESGTLEVEYTITSLIVQPPYVSAHIESKVTGCALGLELPTKVYTGVIGLAMVLKFEDGKIIERTDHAEYSKAFDFLNNIRSSIAKQADDPRCVTND